MVEELEDETENPRIALCRGRRTIQLEKKRVELEEFSILSKNYRKMSVEIELKKNLKIRKWNFDFDHSTIIFEGQLKENITWYFFLKPRDSLTALSFMDMNCRLFSLLRS